MILRLLTALFCLSFATAALAQGAERSFTQVRGDVWRFQNNSHYSLAVRTDEGMVVVDPINADAAAALKEQIQLRFELPVKALIYSHSHADHASGGAVLEAATVIAHENAPESIVGVRPDIRFSDRMSLHVGGKTFELTYLGKGHGEDLIVVVVRPENVAFIVDVAAPKRLPYRDFPGANIDGWIEQLKRVEALDFEVFAPGHGDVGVKADVAETRRYIEQMRAEVLAGLKDGKTVPQLVEAIKMTDYHTWGFYLVWRETNIRGMARWLKETGALK